jgi:flagellar biosynthetic protein FliP
MNDLSDLAGRMQDAGTFQNLSPSLQTALFLGALTLLPALLVSLTSFTRIVIVLSFVRRAVTSQDIPPNIVVTGLALFMTLFTMGPTLEKLNSKAVQPYLDKKLGGPAAIRAGGAELHQFMLRHTRKTDLALFIHMAGLKPLEKPEDTPFRVLVPSFLISELKTAFIMGFCIYLPFLLVDLVIASILTSMGMVLLPPVLISAPFKLLLFVLADGWHLVGYAIGVSYG